MAFKSKNFNKFIATAATAALVATAMAPAASAASFKDVPATSPYASAVDFLTTKGIKGFTDGTFRVGQNITRADAAIMLANVLELDIDAAPSAGFTDTNSRTEKHINALYAANITKGAGNNKFNSNAPITRGELAVWLQRGFGLTSTATKVPFTDVTGQYTPAVAALVENGVTFGKSATLFGTHANATRGEFALFLQRAFAVEEDETTPLEKAIKEAEMAIAALPSVEDLTLEDTSQIDEALALAAEVFYLAVDEELIQNIDVLYALLEKLMELEIEAGIWDDFEGFYDFTDAAVNLDSGEVTLTFTDAEFFDEHQFSATISGTTIVGTVAEALTGEDQDELVITFDPAHLSEASTIEVDVKYYEYNETYIVSYEDGSWTVDYK